MSGPQKMSARLEKRTVEATPSLPGPKGRRRELYKWMGNLKRGLRGGAAEQRRGRWCQVKMKTFSFKKAAKRSLFDASAGCLAVHRTLESPLRFKGAPPSPPCTPRSPLSHLSPCLSHSLPCCGGGRELVACLPKFYRWRRARRSIWLQMSMDPAGTWGTKRRSLGTIKGGVFGFSGDGRKEKSKRERERMMGSGGHP